MQFLKKIFGTNDNFHFYYRDGIWILVDRLLTKKNNDEKDKFIKLKPNNLEFNKKKN